MAEYSWYVRVAQVPDGEFLCPQGKVECASSSASVISGKGKGSPRGRLSGSAIMDGVQPRPSPLASSNPLSLPPLPPLSYPKYSTVIKRPMDLHTMYDKVKLGAFGGLHPDNPAIDPPPSVGDTANGPTLAKALLSPAPAPVFDPAPALTLASPFGDSGPVANGLVPAAHKGDGPGLGSGADAIDAFWSSTIVGGGGQLDSGTAVAESTGGGVGCDWGGFGGVGCDWGGFGGVGVQGNGLNGRGHAWDLVGIREEAGGRGRGNGFANEVGSEADGGRRRVFVSDDAGGEGGTVGAAVLRADEVAGRSGGSGGGRAGEVCGGNAGASGRELMAPAVAAVEAGAVWPPVAFETATAPFDHVAFFRDMKLVSLMWRLHCSRFGLAACLASILSCPLPSTVVAAMFFSARCGGFVFTCLGRASRETNRPPPLPSPPPPQQITPVV